MARKQRLSYIDTKSNREYRFEGELLATVSTQRMGKPRWSELHLYRTPNGQYVLIKAGRSIQYHENRTCIGPRAKQVENGVKAYIEGMPCLKCGPSEHATRYFRENDLVTVIVSKSAEGVVESAHLVDDDKITFLPNIAQRLLQTAATKDEDIADAYNVQVVA